MPKMDGKCQKNKGTKKAPKNGWTCQNKKDHKCQKKDEKMPQIDRKCQKKTEMPEKNKNGQRKGRNAQKGQKMRQKKDRNAKKHQKSQSGAAEPRAGDARSPKAFGTKIAVF